MPVSEVARNRIIRELPVIPKSVIYHENNKPVEVAYCRVSTEEDSQEDSYDRQISHYTDKITADNNVEFGGIYADYGISGTHSETRPEFQRMLADAREGKISIIRCKAIQRFGRNTVDLLTAVRELKELGVAVIFEQQGINTLEMSGEILITIMAAISEQESRNISNNVKFGFKEKFRQGGVQVNWARWMGYQRNEETKELEIIPEEAEIVRRIYREFLAGYSTHNIAEGLMRDGIRTPEWKKPSEKQMKKLKEKEDAWLALPDGEKQKKPLCVWYAKTINNILTNEKYMGDSIQGKTYKVDVLSKKRLVNNGEAAMFHNENTHDGIITRETFGMAQEEMARRNGLRGASNTGRAKFSSKYPLSKMIECGEDGQLWRRYAYYPKGGEAVPVWICPLKKTPKGDPRKCSQHWVREQSIIDAYMDGIKELGVNEDFIKTLTGNIVTSIDDDASGKLASYEEQIDGISQKIVELMRSVMPPDKKQEELKILMAKQDKLAVEKAKLQEQMASHNLSQHRAEMLTEAIENMKLITEFNEQSFKETVEKIIIKDGIARFIFKCGIELSRKVN